MGKKRDLTEADAVDMMGLLEKGLMMKDVAVKYGLHHTSVSRHLQKCGHDPKRYLPKKKGTPAVVFEDFRISPENFSKIDDASKDKVLTAACEHYERNGFPYPSYDNRTLVSSFKTLVNTTITIQGRSIITKTSGNNILNHFFPHRYTTKRKNVSPISCWDNRESLKKFLLNRYTYADGPVTDAVIRTGVSLKGLPANFNPLVAKYVYDNYAPNGGSVLDFSAGFGGRLLGCMISKKKLTYTGIEPLTASYSSLCTMSYFYGQNGLADINKIHIIREPFEGVFLTEHYDLIFSSPPYFNFEQYGEESTQSVVRYPIYCDWLQKFWFVTLSKCCAHLKTGSYLIFSLSNYDACDLVGDTECFLQTLPLEKMPSLNVLYHNVYGNCDRPEPLFCYRKRA